ncbi:FO synthase [Rhodoligotrophos appendicifer]|uniref:5-amino-6-(D-ribitylamino)uracil--L-tyrosine 4-hydroxyphenyl transferase CofH n=1 Tax=Rhodoligotrophos appendicifer TaxID=987056 RepID=UPI0011855909|nr:5-amino-6-(D-ribitylamino)uracil--L-tyrosine 4-hydroxyphenyl transferase CofH [Rhodoligotrophos appendicifer]
MTRTCFPRLSDAEARSLADHGDLRAMMRAAAERRDAGHGDIVSYSRKVFIPLTHLCRDVCHYCTFAQPPQKGQEAFLTPEQVLAIARAGAAAGCKEALFTLGDKPELRYRLARDELARLGHADTLSYLAAMAELVLQETGLLPHLNPGIMTPTDLARLRPVSISMGLMLEASAERLGRRGGPHHGSPDKQPLVRLRTIDDAGRARIPFTSGILIGIGETRAERIEALLALRASHEAHGHLQEIIIQNFRAKPGTRMADAPEPSAEEHLWTVAAARMIFEPAMTIQAPPNLSTGSLADLIDAGINDWGGVSPVTIDHVNPEAPWPHLDALARQTAEAGKVLTERLALYPAYVHEAEAWVDGRLRRPLLEHSDAQGFARLGQWTPGSLTEHDGMEPDWAVRHVATPARRQIDRAISRAEQGAVLDEPELVALFGARGEDFHRVCAAADGLRRAACGDDVTYVVTRNINYTNICSFKCQFCAFSKGKLSENLRGRPYDLGLDEIQRRVVEAWSRGATEVCLQGGIHPAYTGETYLAILRAVKDAAPDMHVHAFSPLEVFQGAATLGVPVREFLKRLKDEGLGSLPGTAAEILDDSVRAVICPDKITTEEWLAVMREAHALGLRSTSTIMFGHVDRHEHWARHLLRLRSLQDETGGFTEFVPLPFVPMETPIYLKGRSRRGATLREAILMHAVARLALHRSIANIQVSWVKMGVEGARACLQAGANDLGGTLMNETISRAAGASHGQEMTPAALQHIAASLGRRAWQRTTLYGTASEERCAAAGVAPELEALQLRPAEKSAEAWIEFFHHDDKNSSFSMEGMGS